MPNVLTKSSSLTCGHPPGHADLSMVTSKLTVLGDPVVLVGDIKNMVGCPIVLPGAPCSAITLTPGTGVSAKLKVGGRPVMLETVVGTTVGSPPPPVFKVAVVQKKLSAV